MFTTKPLFLALHQQWKLRLNEWAADGSLGAAAEAAFRLEGRPAALAVLNWLAGATAAQAMAVLIEELGQHLNGLLNVVDTPGMGASDLLWPWVCL